MSESLFDHLAALLELRTAFDRLEARGTLRIALKQAGLEPSSLDPAYARAVLDKLLPHELEKRGVADARALCASLAEEIYGADDDGSDRPEGLFQRLASR